MRQAFLGFVVIVLVGLGGAAVWRANINAEAAGGGRGGFGGRSVAVALAEIDERAFADVVEALGTARANESIDITSQLTDVVSSVSFDSGDFVEEGQALAALADAEETAALTEARSAYDEAQRELARFTDLSARGVAARVQIDELDSAVDQARARLRAVEARLDDRIIRAPFSGVVGLRNASPGMLVRPGDAIATLDDVSVIKLDFSVPERFLSVLAPGAPLEARSSAYPGDVFAGVIAAIDTRVDPVTRTVIARAEIPNAQGRLRPGMLMTVDLRRNERLAPAAPELAVLREGAQAFVYVAQEGEAGLAAERRPVVTGVRAQGYIEVLDGLSVGERVVAEGVHRLRPGAPIRAPAGSPGGAAGREGGGAASGGSGGGGAAATAPAEQRS